MSGPDPSPPTDAAYAAWRALAERTLKGAPFESLTSRTADGVPLQPLYPPGSVAPHTLDWGDRDLDRPWDVRTLVAHPTAEGMNAQALDDLQGGGHSVLLTLDRTGCTGLVASDPADLARALEGVVTDLAPVALDAGFQGIEAARWLSAAAKGGPTAPLALHLDPIGAFAEAGASSGQMTAWIDAAAATARDLHDVHPRASLFLASGRVVHEAGGSEAQELAFALSGAGAYARALEAAGLERGEALRRIVLGFSADGRPLVTIAKLRAARLLWERLTTALGAPARAVIEARGSLRMLSTMDAWTNLIRVTAAGFGAACGGADAIVLPPFTAPTGRLPTALARRQARNTQLVLMEEAGLGRVADPGEGAAAVEALTDGIARAAWSAFQAIEAEGGAVAALRKGRLQAEVAAARENLARDAASGASVIVGVNKFTDRTGALAPGEAWPQAPAAASITSMAGEDDVCVALTPWRIAAPFETHVEAAR